MDDKYLERRKHIERFFIPENLTTDSGKIDISPSGRFQIEINRYLTLPNSWNYSRGIVTNISNGEIIVDVKRNYGHFGILGYNIQMEMSIYYAAKTIKDIQY